MRNYKLIFLLLLLVFNASPTQGIKIQKSDTWQYEDSFNVIHNETAINIVQLDAGTTITSVAEVSTTRGYSFPLNTVISTVG